MDMAPPEPPAAITRTANEDATTLVMRIAASHRWFIDQQAFLPTIRVKADSSVRRSFMEELAAFWQAPVAAHPDQRPVARLQAFVLRWAAVMADEALLRAADGTLDEPAEEAILAFTSTQGQLIPPHIQVRELMTGTLPYAGSLVLVNRRDNASALLFTGDRGWERFVHLDALHAELEERLREALASGEKLPGLAGDDFPVLSGDLSVTSREIATDTFNVLARNIVDVQKRKVLDAWTQRDDHEGAPLRLADRLHDALLSQSLPAATGPSGLHVMTLDPGRPSRQIVEIMRGKSRTNTFTDKQVRNIAGAYVEIDLGKLRDRQRRDGTYEFNVYTVSHRSELEFVIKPTLPAPDLDTAPLSPRRQRDLAGVSLHSGEFRTGLRVP